jgi:hypothetical protein
MKKKTRDAPNNDFAGYQISGAGRITDIRPDINSTFKCLVKYEIKDIRCIEDFFFPELKKEKKNN